MLAPLPDTIGPFMSWSWPQIEPYFVELGARDLTPDTVQAWLANWSRLDDLIDEAYWRLYVANSINTADQVAQRQYQLFLDEIYQPFLAIEQKLKEKMLSSQIEPFGFEVPLRKMRAEVTLFRKANVPLLMQEQKLETEYDRIIGAQTLIWDGTEQTTAQLAPLLQHPDRQLRERAWRSIASRELADRASLDALWQQFLSLRRQLAANAGFENYRTFRWQQLGRLDYTPEDCQQLHQAIEQIAVPAATRIYEKRRLRLGIETLRPWDLKGPQGLALVVDPPECPPLHPFDSVSQLVSGCTRIFAGVLPQFGSYIETMFREDLLDLENRKDKAPSSYCTSFQVARRPFIFMNAVGLSEDVGTLLHEAGHAFHIFERSHLPYHQQRAERASAIEFDEVAATAMEFLALPYLEASKGGFYSEADSTRAQRERLEEAILFWPYIAVVDTFQHWIYENPERAMDPSACDAHWQVLWQRFMPGVDWHGLDEELRMRWRRQLHIYTVPFYYIEYGLAQLGALQVWRNSLSDASGAVLKYRRALALGSTAALPDLYVAAGAQLAFDADTLGGIVELMERTIDELDTMEIRQSGALEAKPSPEAGRRVDQSGS